ncbi:hypothetical protein ACFVTE_09240 [Arthrobacter sp. NPDC058097]|uniref:hypothetical protein n=1 Tax=Arthrobacter sp. NPDC058097 TaxID=3346340 RepID=UPI0036D97381
MFTLPWGTAPGMMGWAVIIKKTTDDKVRLKGVRAGEIVKFGGIPLRVLSTHRDADLVTLKLEDKPERPMTFLGVADMAVHRVEAP